jgi:hypothetical protein
MATSRKHYFLAATGAILSVGLGMLWYPLAGGIAACTAAALISLSRGQFEKRT